MTTSRESETGKRLLWATAAATDRELLEATAGACKLSVRLCTPTELPALLRPVGDLVGIELVGDWGSGLAAIRELHTRAPGTPIVAASADAANVDLLRAAMHAGANDVLTLPLVSLELHKALLRLTRPTATPTAAATTTGQLITVYGARGGLGATTIAVNLAGKLATVTQSETAVVDLDLQRGDVAAFMNLTPVHSLATLATASGDIDELFFASTIMRHVNGVSVLAAPPTLEEVELVTDREVELALRLMQSRFAYTVIDTPRVVTSPVLAALEASDRIFVLTDLSVPSVRAARRFFELLERVDIVPDRVELLVTEIVAGPLDLKKAMQALGKEAFAIIPRDDSAGSAMNDGVPLNGRPTRLALAIDGLARRLAGVQPGSKSSSRRFLSRIFPKGVRP